MERISLYDAVRRGIARVFDPRWAFGDTYLKLDIIVENEGQTTPNYHGPWVYLYSPTEQKVAGLPTPQELLWTAFDWDEEGWEIYNGPKANGDERDFIVVRRQ